MDIFMTTLKDYLKFMLFSAKFQQLYQDGQETKKIPPSSNISAQKYSAL